MLQYLSTRSTDSVFIRLYRHVVTYMQPVSTTACTTVSSVSIEILSVVIIKIGLIAYTGCIYNSWTFIIIFNANKTAQVYYNVTVKLIWGFNEILYGFRDPELYEINALSKNFTPVLSDLVANYFTFLFIPGCWPHVIRRLSDKIDST